MHPKATNVSADTCANCGQGAGKPAEVKLAGCESTVDDEAMLCFFENFQISELWVVAKARVGVARGIFTIFQR